MTFHSINCIESFTAEGILPRRDKFRLEQRTDFWGEGGVRGREVHNYDLSWYELHRVIHCRRIPPRRDNSFGLNKGLVLLTEKKGAKKQTRNISGATWARVLHRVRRAQGPGTTWATRWRTRPRALRAAPLEGNLGDTIHPWSEQLPPLRQSRKKAHKGPRWGEMLLSNKNRVMSSIHTTTDVRGAARK